MRIVDCYWFSLALSYFLTCTTRVRLSAADLCMECGLGEAFEGWHGLCRALHMLHVQLSCSDHHGEADGRLAGIAIVYLKVFPCTLSSEWKSNCW